MSSLLESCINKLGQQSVIQSESRTTELFDKLQEEYTFTFYGRIDWARCKVGNVQELRRLLQNGLDPNKYVNLSPLIRYATYYNQQLLVKELLLFGANPDLPDKERGMTALINAAYKGYAEIIETLLPYSKKMTTGILFMVKLH